MSDINNGGTEQLRDGEVGLILRSVSSPWGPLAEIGNDWGTTPGDWWGAFWCDAEAHLRQHQWVSEQETKQEPDTEQQDLTAYADDGSACFPDTGSEHSGGTQTDD